MSAFAILILALSMSADAFAASLARGASHRPGNAEALRAGLVFGIIEGLTPVAGWALGRAAQGLVEQWDHWIAFGLLAIVGAHMIRNGLAGGPHADESAPRRAGLLLLLLTALGTSIDAAAVGVGLAMIDVNILVVAAAIGFSTFVCTTIGMRIGGLAGEKLGARVELAAGIALICLGTAILVEHLGLLAH